MSYLDYLPWFYADIPEIAAVGSAFDAENEQLIGQFAMIPRDAVISTAEEDRILQWEKLLGIIPQDRTLVQRRMMVLGRLKGAGKLNEAKIKSIVETFSGGDSIVSFSDSTLTVRVAPPEWGEVFLFPDVEKALAPLVPAHLNLVVERYYNTWEDRMATYGSWCALKTGYDAVTGDMGTDCPTTNLAVNGDFSSGTTGWASTTGTMSVIDFSIYDTVFPIPCSAGLMDFLITNGDDVLWLFPDGTISTADRPSKTLTEAGTVLLFCTNFSAANLIINDAGTDARYLGDLSDLPPLTYWLNLENCTNITGDLSDLPPLTYLLSLNGCANVTGDLADLPCLTGILSLPDCPNITGSLSDLPALSYTLRLSGCPLVAGAYTSVNGANVPTYTYLNNTGLSAVDLDNTLIAYAACTRNNGTFSAVGMTRTAASDAAVSNLTGRGWAISGITKV